MLRRGLLRREAPILPSLYDRFPDATAALRRPRGLREVPLERIIGTARHPSQNTPDFLPLPGLRGRNWRARWDRIRRANEQLNVLPAVELLQVGEDFYVVDGHNRVAAALRAGAGVVDADVIELVVPGIEPGVRGAHHSDAATLLAGADELRQAGTGRQSRTAEHRSSIDELRREALTGQSETLEDPE